MIVQVLQYLAFAISAALAAWMLYDTIRVGRNYSEDYLTTSIEGADELFDRTPAPEPATTNGRDR